MPGPVSDSYDPEWGTSANAAEIVDELRELYTRLSIVLGSQPPIPVLTLVRSDLPTPRPAVLTEKDWRLLRFSVERAIDSI